MLSAPGSDSNRSVSMRPIERTPAHRSLSIRPRPPTAIAQQRRVSTPLPPSTSVTRLVTLLPKPLKHGLDVSSKPSYTTTWNYPHLKSADEREVFSYRRDQRFPFSPTQSPRSASGSIGVNAPLRDKFAATCTENPLLANSWSTRPVTVFRKIVNFSLCGEP